MGLSDDPLSLMLEQQAVARNISRHAGDVLSTREVSVTVRCKGLTLIGLPFPTIHPQSK